jgi:hypothetical protein
MAKPLTLLESVLVQMLAQMMIASKPRAPSDWEYKEMVEVLMRTGLTKLQANKALGR